MTVDRLWAESRVGEADLSFCWDEPQVPFYYQGTTYIIHHPTEGSEARRLGDFLSKDFKAGRRRSAADGVQK